MHMQLIHILCFMDKIGVISHTRAQSVHGRRYCGVRTLPIENALQGEKLGEMGEGHRTLIPQRTFLVFEPLITVQTFIKIKQKLRP